MSNENDRLGKVPRVADILCTHLPLMEGYYNKYCSEKEQIAQEILDKCQKNPEFEKLLTKDPVIKTYFSYLGLRLTPIQRVARQGKAQADFVLSYLDTRFCFEQLKSALIALFSLSGWCCEQVLHG